MPLGGRFICLDLPQLAKRTFSRLSGDEISRLLAVGASGGEFARTEAPDVETLGVETVAFVRERERRTLEVKPCELAYQPILIDDIAVSGLTLAVARAKVEPTPETAVVGMLYRSRRLRRRIGTEDIRSGVTYCRLGGGSPPINSAKTLCQVPERLDALACRYFDDSEELKRIITGEE